MYTSEYPIINVTVDIIVGIGNGTFNQEKILLIRRGQEPFKGKFAMPGGYVNADEEVLQAAKRELLEETGLDIEPSQFMCLGVADKLDRDPRGRTISFVFDLLISQEQALGARAADDAASISIVHQDSVKDHPEWFAFDHHSIIFDTNYVL